MSFARRRIVGWLIGVLLGVHAIAIVCKYDNWPISCYPMFSSIQESQYRLPTLCGVAADGQEVRLHESRYWKPLSVSELLYAIRQHERSDRKLRKRDPAAANNAQQAVGALFDLYEQNRASGSHAGPRLVALRLYYTTWELDPHLRNLDSPVAKELAHEAAAPPELD